MKFHQSLQAALILASKEILSRNVGAK